MFLQNPRLSAISKKIRGMNADDLAEHIEIYGLRQNIIQMINENFMAKRGAAPEIMEMVRFVPTNELLKMRICGDQTLQLIRIFLIDHLRKRENVTRANQDKSDRGVESSEPGRVEV